MADAFLVIEAAGAVVSALLAFWIALKSATAFSATGRTHLVNFSAGFACLGFSYFVSAYTIGFLDFSDIAELLRVLVGILGFSLIASSYLTKERPGSLGLLFGIVAAVALAGFSSVYLEDFSSHALLGGGHLVAMTLAMFIIVRVSKSYAESAAPRAFYVLWGFGLLAVSQYTWVIWAYIPELPIAGLAMTVRFVALVSLFASLKR